MAIVLPAAAHEAIPPRSAAADGFGVESSHAAARGCMASLRPPTASGSRDMSVPNARMPGARREFSTWFVKASATCIPEPVGQVFGHKPWDMPWCLSGRGPSRRGPQGDGETDQSIGGRRSPRYSRRCELLSACRDFSVSDHRCPVLTQALERLRRRAMRKDRLRTLTATRSAPIDGCALPRPETRRRLTVMLGARSGRTATA